MAESMMGTFTTTTAAHGARLTDAAVQKARSLLTQEGRDELRLRVAMQPGGGGGAGAWKRGVGLAIVVALASSAFVFVSAQSAHALGTNGCAAMRFIGVRGSGEVPTGPVEVTMDPANYDESVSLVGSVGTEIRGLGNKLQELVNGDVIQNNSTGYAVTKVTNGLAEFLAADVASTVQVDALIYPASSTDLLKYGGPAGVGEYMASVDLGVTYLVQELTSDAAACPDQRFILAGYSQGAMVIHEALNQLAANGSALATTHRLAAVVLLADPLRRGYGVGTHFGSAPTDLLAINSSGIMLTAIAGYAHPDLPIALGSIILDYCTVGDAVCSTDLAQFATDATGATLGFGIHGSYGASDMSLLALYAAKLINQTDSRAPIGSAILDSSTRAVPYVLGAGPYDMAARADGSLYVTSGGNRSTIFGFLPDGGVSTVYATPAALAPAYPYGVATDWAGNLYSTFTYASKLVRYTAGGTNVIDLTPYSTASWGNEGSPLAVDRSGNIYLGRGYRGMSNGCSFGGGAAGNVYKLSPKGDYLGDFPTGDFLDIASDALGNVYVLTGAGAILRIDSLGSLTSYATMPSTFSRVGASMASDSVGNIYVIHNGYASYNVCTPVPDPASSPIWRVDAQTRQVAEWASAERGRFKIAMVSDHQLAVYVDPTFGGSPSIERFTIGTLEPLSTTSTVTVSPSGSALAGTAVPVTGTVSPSSAVGTIEILDGTTSLGSGAVTSGVFTVNTSTLALGSHTLTARFTPTNAQDYQASTSTTLTFSVNQKETPAAPPSTNTDQLENLIKQQNLDVSGTTGAFVPSGDTVSNPLNSLDASKPFSGTLPWSEGTDSFVDVYAYSSPVFLGTFPVINGKVQMTGINLSALQTGAHHIVFVGQTSGTVSAMAVTVVAPKAAAEVPASSVSLLSSTGADPAVPIGAAGTLLLLGLGLLIVAARRRSSGIRQRATAAARSGATNVSAS